MASRINTGFALIEVMLCSLLVLIFCLATVRISIDMSVLTDTLTNTLETLQTRQNIQSTLLVNDQKIPIFLSERIKNLRLDTVIDEHDSTSIIATWKESSGLKRLRVTP